MPASRSPMLDNLIAYQSLRASLTDGHYGANGTMWWSLGHNPACPISVVPLSFSPETFRHDVDEALRRFQAERLPANWTLFPEVSDPAFCKHLRSERRLMGPMLLPEMHLNLDSMVTECPNSGPFDFVRIEPNSDVDLINLPSVQWQPKAGRFPTVQLLSKLLTHPDVEIWAGFVDRRPVTSLLLFKDAGTVGVYDVVTSEEYRNRGAASANLWTALSAAKGQGFERACLLAHKRAANLYRQLGFVEVGVARSYYYSRPRMEKDAILSAQQGDR